MKYKDPFINYLRTLGYHQKTLYSKERHIAYYLQWYLPQDPLAIDSSVIKKYYRYLFEQKPYTRIITINHYMVTLNQFYDWCCKFGYLQLHPFGDFTLKKDPIQNTRKPIAETIIQELNKACIYPIEKLIIILGYGCGLRTSEIQQLKVKDIHTDKGLIIVHSGKFNKRRSIPLSYKHIEYIKNHIIHKNLKQQDYLFTTETGRISQQSLRKKLKELQQRIGTNPPYFGMHHLRHSIASHLVENGVAIQLVQQFLGHTTLQTTQNYVTLTKNISYENHTTMGRKTSKNNMPQL